MESKEHLLLECAKTGKLEDMKKLFVRDKALDINSKGATGWTALMHACKLGHFSIVRYLINKRGIDVDVQNNDGWTALMVACAEGQTKIVRLLVVNAKANINEQNNQQKTALMLATSKGYLDIIQILFHPGDANPNLTDERGWTALFIAATKGYFDIVTFLVEKTAINVHTVDKNGNTAYDWAEDEDTKKYLIDKMNERSLENEEENISSTASINLPSKRRRWTMSEKSANQTTSAKEEMIVEKEVHKLDPEEELEKHKATIRELGSELETEKEKVNELSMSLSTKAEELAQMGSQLKEAKETIASLESSIEQERNMALFLTEKLKESAIELTKQREEIKHSRSSSSRGPGGSQPCSSVLKLIDAAMVHFKAGVASLEDAKVKIPHPTHSGSTK